MSDQYFDTNTTLTSFLALRKSKLECDVISTTLIICAATTVVTLGDVLAAPPNLGVAASQQLRERRMAWSISCLLCLRERVP
jgi:hypothetical protein